MILAHKIRLYPNAKQEGYFKKACGVARFAYNWALEESNREYSSSKKVLMKSDLSKRLNAIKRESFPWMQEVTKTSSQNAVYNLGDSFVRYFKGQNKYPKFKKKGKCKDSFYLTNQSLKLKKKRVFIAKLGWVKMSQELRFDGKIMSATVSRTSDKWFISIHVELPDPKPVKESHVIGVDLGIKSLMVSSDGKCFDNKRIQEKGERKIRKLQKSLSRKSFKSKNWYKAKLKLSKAYNKQVQQKQDVIHKATTTITKSCGTICIESFDFSSWLKNPLIKKQSLFSGVNEVIRQFEYKTVREGVTLVRADRFYPSSKLCSNCGHKKDDLTLSIRTYKCDQCGLVIDRDYNAALNLKQLAVGFAESLNACGDGSSGLSPVTETKLPSVNQEEKRL